MEPLAESALQAVEKGDLTIIPERFEKVVQFYCLSYNLFFFLFRIWNYFSAFRVLCVWLL